MGEIEKLPENNNVLNEKKILERIPESLILDAKTEIAHNTSFSMPIAQLSALGAGAASLLPELRTVTRTTTVNTHDLYQLVNAGAGDVLKAARNGNYWGAIKTADGASKMAQLRATGPITVTTDAVAAINPATLMMAVALFSIEQQLGNIAETERQIISFLETEKEAETEADIETLFSVFSQFKYNWDNEHYVDSNHKMIMDIQRTARKNIIVFRRQVEEAMSSKRPISAQNKVNSILEEMMRKFNYYRLSLFAFSMASMLEVMLSGNFKEEYIAGIKSEVETGSMKYRELYARGSIYIEEMSHESVETNVLNCIGTASDAVGKFLGKIPVVKKGPVDEFLQDNGAHLKKDAKAIERSAVGSFAKLSNPGTGVFLEKLSDMIQIYNHTDKIYFDDKNIYLASGRK